MSIDEIKQGDVLIRKCLDSFDKNFNDEVVVILSVKFKDGSFRHYDTFACVNGKCCFDHFTSFILVTGVHIKV